MTFVESIFNAFGYAKTSLIAKANPVGKLLIPYWGGGLTISPPLKYEEYSEQGYKLNAIARAAIDKIATTCSKIPLKLQRKNADGDYEDVDGKEDQEHPLMMLMAKPNSRQRYKQYVKALIGYNRIAGNVYQIRNSLSPSSETKELFLLRPDRMRCIPGDDGEIAKWVYSSALGQMEFEMDVPEGTPVPISHWREFNPLDEWYGLSPLGSAAMQICQHNEAAHWNARAVKNGMRPDGVFSYKPGEMDAVLTEEQKTALKDEIKTKLSGAKGAHDPLILDGGFTWQEMQIAPKDLDWLEGSRDAARTICLVIGCPPILLNIPGDNTYKNYEEARGALHEDTCIPLMQEVVDDWNEWIVPQFGEDLQLALDLEKVSALDYRRREKWDRVNNATFLSTNEKRTMMDIEPDPNKAADAILVSSSMVPLTDEAAAEMQAQMEGEQQLDEDGNPIEPEDDAEGEGEDAGEGEDTASEDEGKKPAFGKKKPAFGKKPEAPFAKACKDIEGLASKLIHYKSGSRNELGRFGSPVVVQEAVAAITEAEKTVDAVRGNNTRGRIAKARVAIAKAEAMLRELSKASMSTASASVSTADLSKLQKLKDELFDLAMATPDTEDTTLKSDEIKDLLGKLNTQQKSASRVYEAKYDATGKFVGIVSKAKDE
jgi:HK97 family phage portal protein